MRHHLDFRIHSQPDNISCGPTCLHALYNFYGDSATLDEVIRQVPMLETGGTLGVILGNHALKRGYRATLYTYNLQVFDPTWFHIPGMDIAAKLALQREAKTDPKLRMSSDAYIEFIRLGGKLAMEDLTPGLLRRHLKRGNPLLAGLSATWLYRTMRELPHNEEDDDIHGEPLGHFVVIFGYDPDERAVWVADPHAENPIDRSPYYCIGIDRAVTAILLGVLTYDANFLVIEPKPAQKKE